MHAIQSAVFDDSRELCEIYAGYVRDSIISLETEPPSVEEFTQRMETVLAMYPFLVSRSNGHIDGYAYASQFNERPGYRFCVATTIYLHPDATGKGIGEKLYSALLTLLEGQGVRNAYALIALPNPRSIGLHEKLGFEPAGRWHGCGFKLGRWIDVACMEKQFDFPAGKTDDITPVWQLDEKFVRDTMEQRG